jgi:hypothetical protein
MKSCTLSSSIESCINGDARLSTLTQTSIDGSGLLKHCYGSDWFPDGSEGQIYIRYYSHPREPAPGFYIPGLEGDVVMYCGTPFRVVVANISDQKYTLHIPWLVRSSGDKNSVVVEEINRVLPEADYVLISTPIVGRDASAYESASSRMDEFVGMLRLIGGNNLLRELVRDGAVEIVVSPGNMSTLSKVVPVPQDCEGPFATAGTWEAFSEVVDALERATNSERARIMLAMQLIEKAFLSQSTLKFFNYWVALEVAAGGDKTEKIIPLLSKAYGKEKNGYVQNDLGYTQLKDTRNAVFHNGEHYEMRPEVERYFQCLFLDVVRARLGLLCKRYMSTAIECGFDVRQLDRAIGRPNVMTVAVARE